MTLWRRLQIIKNKMPRWRRWPRLAETCSSSSRDTLPRPPGDSSSACPGNRPQPTARTLRSKRDTRPGSLGLWRRVSEQQGSLTSRESSKFQQRRRKGSCGKNIIQKPPSKSPNHLHHYNVYNTLPPPLSPLNSQTGIFMPWRRNRPLLKTHFMHFCKSNFFFEGLPFVHYTERFDHDIALAKNTLKKAFRLP